MSLVESYLTVEWSWSNLNSICIQQKWGFNWPKMNIEKVRSKFLGVMILGVPNLYFACVRFFCHSVCKSRYRLEWTWAVKCLYSTCLHALSTCWCESCMYGAPQHMTLVFCVGIMVQLYVKFICNNLTYVLHPPPTHTHKYFCLSIVVPSSICLPI